MSGNETHFWESAGFRLALDASPLGMLLIDRSGRIISENSAATELFGGELLGLRVEDLLPKEMAQRHVGLREGFHKAPSRRAMGVGRDLHAVRRDGSRFPVEIGLNPFTEGEQTYVLASISDISVRVSQHQVREKQMAQAMESQRLRSLGLMAGGIAHDFNNLLVGILGNASFAAQLIENDHPAMECLDDLQLAAERASDLARQMLAYSGKGRFVVRPLDVADLLSETRLLLRSQVPSHVRVQYKLPEGMALVQADAAQLQQVFSNLVTNAIQAIDKEEGLVRVQCGEVVVDASYLDQMGAGDLSAGRYVFIEVSDNGSGMNTKVVAQIFEPFFTTKSNGHGLGLSAVQGIVKGHQGAIAVYSEPGLGTTFRVLLPALDAGEPRKDEPITKGRVLIVDDDNIVRGLAKRVLKHAGYDVIEASNGHEAVEVFKATANIDVVLMDLTMPRMGGQEALGLLRSLDKELQVILSSGFNEQDAISDLRRDAQTRFLQKPYNAKALAAIVGRAIAGEEE